MKKIYSLFLILTLLSACSVKSDKTHLTPADADNGGEEQGQSVGPFKIEFAPNSNAFEHNIDIAINQSEGYFEYNFIAPTRHTLSLKSAAATFTGCDQSVPTFEIFWLPNPQDRNLFTKVSPNKKFSSIANVQSQMLFSFKKIEGCQKLQLKVNLEKIAANPRLGQNCDANISNCKVLVACKEPGASTYFYEAEVWNQSGILYLKKFLNRGDGTRSLQTSITAKQSDSASKYIYTSFNNNTQLTIDKISSISVFKDYINGYTYTHDLTCD